MRESDNPLSAEPTLRRVDRSSFDAESATLAAADAPRRVTDSAHLARGSSIGRYLVLDKLGAGGMGVVYAAYDPELDRKIAIKVLQPRHFMDGDATRGKARLVREAQALARLSHPNVVSVHDVGEENARVFVAMEHIDGCTLKQWLAQAPRARAEILDKYIQAGRGLAAAHAAGLVHRDFKPDNVLVGSDGRPRVVDFGLARGGASAADGDVNDLPGSGVSQLDNDLTAEGAVMGTPAYMAPEQHQGGPVDAGTDQFAFCVGLYKALYGERPFAGGSVRAVARAVCGGEVRAAPVGTKVPTWLRRVLLRGLRPKSAERYPSMTALLAALARDPVAARTKRWLVGGGALAVAGVVAAAYVSGANARNVACATAGEPIAAVWTAARGAEVAAAFQDTTLVYAAETYARVEEALNRYAADWRQAARAACEATHIAQTQSTELLDRRTACLDTRREAMDAMLDAFARADAGVVERAGAAVLGLPAISSCADLAALTRGVAPPSTQAMRIEVDAITVALERAAATDRAGRYAQAWAEHKALAERAERVGYPPVLARAVHELANSERTMGLPQGRDTTLRAFELGLEAGYDLVAIRAALDLAHQFGVEESDVKQGSQWHAIATALLRRSGGDPLAENAAMNVEAVLAVREGRDADAQRLFETILTRSRAQDDPSLNVASALANLAAFHGGQHDLERARAYLVEAADLTTTLRGPHHPSLLNLQAKLALLAALDGDYAEAREQFTVALVGLREVYGDRHPEVARALAGLGMAERHLGNFAVAERVYRESLDQRREFLGPDHIDVAGMLVYVASVRADQGFYEDAVDLARQASEIHARVSPASEPSLAHDRREMGRSLLALGRYDEASTVLELARDVYLQDPKETARTVETLVRLGQAQRGTGNQAAARETLERAVEVAATQPGEGLRTLAAVELAISLRALGGDEARIAALVPTDPLPPSGDVVRDLELAASLETFRATEAR